jgi:uncharacterized protein
MPKRREFDGTHWDTEEIRREREEGWFRQNEARLIEEARQRRAKAESEQRNQQIDSQRVQHWKKCPKCGSDMHTETIEGVDVEKCSNCEGIFFDRGELETLLLRHDEHRRGFFRRLLGFHRE